MESWRAQRGVAAPLSQAGPLSGPDRTFAGDIASGDTEKLIGRLQERYGYARDEAKREVDDFFAQHPVR